MNEGKKDTQHPPISPVSRRSTGTPSVIKCRGGFWTSWQRMSRSHSLPLFLPVTASWICWELEVPNLTSLSGWRRSNIKEYLHSIRTQQATKFSEMSRWAVEWSVFWFRVQQNFRIMARSVMGFMMILLLSSDTRLIHVLLSLAWCYDMQFGDSWSK